ncbi:MAG: ComF family protein [Ignavibacteriales bacterium]
MKSLPGIKMDFRPTGAGHSSSGGQPISRVRAAGLYRGDLKHAIWRFKYGGEQHLCEPLGALIVRVAEDIVPGAAVVPVPLHPAREKRRGFNQALLLAKVVARLSGSVVEAGKLTRVRETLPQSSLKPGERRHNVEGAFRVAPAGALRGLRILLVDDVFTTGSTVRECARTMLACGARSVDVVVCAMVEGSVWR